MLSSADWTREPAQTALQANVALLQRRSIQVKYIYIRLFKQIFKFTIPARAEDLKFCIRNRDSLQPIDFLSALQVKLLEMPVIPQKRCCQIQMWD
ncbi:hypothetical protein WL84_18130 [Burkholderia cenocepacia]|nr:hypothetical protein WJ14_16270 [Burkholderia cenocepacia]KWF22994.1 hypothetical protein WL84_18130 [Burkholderia cenocepacia]